MQPVSAHHPNADARPSSGGGSYLHGLFHRRRADALGPSGRSAGGRADRHADGDRCASGAGDGHSDPRHAHALQRRRDRGGRAPDHRAPAPLSRPLRPLRHAPGVRTGRAPTAQRTPSLAPRSLGNRRDQGER